MKKLVSIAPLSLSMSTVPAAFAGGDGKCHFHGSTPAKESVVVGCANSYKDALVSKGKLDASWKNATLDKAELVAGKDKKEWKLSFKNAAEKDASKQTLYMFFNLTGNYIGANFSGK